MRGYRAIIAVAVILALIPLIVTSNLWLNIAFTALLACLLGQGWNILGGYAGQFSFGHAVFFGTGAYVTAIVMTTTGINPWAAFVLGIAGGALVGAAIGFLVFRYGLRGSYFALVTLAFAEVFRVLANTMAITGGGSGLVVSGHLRPELFQQTSRLGAYAVAAALVVGVLFLTRALENSRTGAYFVAIRENEDAARALGVDPFGFKLRAIVLSAAITAMGGTLYVQVFPYIDAPLMYGPRYSVEALLVPIIGGMGTVFGPLLGAVVLHLLAEAATMITGDIAGLNLVLYGVVLVLMVRFLPRGLIGLFDPRVPKARLPLPRIAGRRRREAGDA
ncbi:MAG: branched-chain amino acid ABC transporter permease [Azospirillaceae bacterium]